MAARRTRKPTRKAGQTTGAARPPRASGPDPELARVQRFLDAMTAAGAVELELGEGKNRVRIRMHEEKGWVGYMPGAPAMPGPQPPGPLPQMPTAAGSAPAPAAPEVAGEVFKSPMVGTFYRATSPDAEPFVKVGDRVTADRTLCIIEAMKVMNEIKAETEGEIVEILAQNGQPVEFGQPLFVLKRA
jgi:acetyl-CoA carboxylase biotin carboxyl carrier protein